MGFIQLAERHQATKRKWRQLADWLRAAEARKKRIRPWNPWKSRGGQAAQLPKPVGLLDRVYRPVVKKQHVRRAQDRDAEALIPHEQRQWRWSRLNPGLDEYGWVRTDTPLQAFDRCPICSSLDGNGAHRLHLGRHTIKELQRHAKSIGVSSEVLGATVSHPGLAPEQTKQALIDIILEARKYKHELHNEWRKHTTSLLDTLGRTRYLHESALRRELEALTPNALVKIVEESTSQAQDEAETASEREPTELGYAHNQLINSIIDQIPPVGKEKETDDLTPDERKEEMRRQLQQLTPTALWARAREVEVSEVTIQAAVKEESDLISMVMDTHPPSLATRAGEAGVSAKEISDALKLGGEGYRYEGQASGQLKRTGYWEEYSSLSRLAEDSGTTMYELQNCSESELRTLIGETAAASPDESKDREERIVSDWEKQKRARAELTKLIRSGTHQFHNPHPKHTESQLKRWLLTRNDKGQAPTTSDGDAAVLHSQRLGSSTAQNVQAKTQKYHRRGGPLRDHPKYRPSKGQRHRSSWTTDGVSVEELRQRAAARGISDGRLMALKHAHGSSPEREKEAILTLLMQYPGQLSHLITEQPKGLTLVRRKLMSMPIADLRERLLPKHETRLLSEEEQDLPGEERRALTLERLANEERRATPQFIPVDPSEPDDEIDGAFGLPPSDVDYTRNYNLRNSVDVPPAWDGKEWPYGYTFKSGDSGLGFYRDPQACKEEVERAKLVHEILGPQLAVGMDFSVADVGDTTSIDHTATRQLASDGLNESTECLGKPCVNPVAGLHHKECPCFNPDSRSGNSSEAGAPPAWLDKAVSNAAAAVASTARTGCDLSSNQRHRHRWLPVGNSIPARSDRRTGLQKHPVWDTIVLQKGGLAASVVDSKNGGVRHLIGPSVAFDGQGNHIQGSSDARLRRMLANRKKVGQPPARHDFWLDKHTFGGSRAQLQPDPGRPTCTKCGKRHTYEMGSSCVQRIHKVISSLQHRTGSKPCLGKPRCVDAGNGVHHRACPCICVMLENEADGVTATKAVTVEFSPRTHVPFDIHVPPGPACPEGAVITIGMTVDVGHAAALHIEGLHRDNAMQNNARSRSNKGGRKVHTGPCGESLTTESHSHRVMPGSEPKSTESDSDDDYELEAAPEVSVAAGPSEYLARWNDMTTEQRTSALQVFHQMSDMNCTGSKSVQLAEKIAGIVDAAHRYGRADRGDEHSPSRSGGPRPSRHVQVHGEETAMQDSLRNSGVFSDLGRPELLKQWSEDEWEELRAMRLDKHAAEGDIALLSGCVGFTDVGEEQLAALRGMANATIGMATTSDAPGQVETYEPNA